MKLLHGAGFSDSERKNFRPLALKNVLIAGANMLNFYYTKGTSLTDEESVHSALNPRSP